MTIATIEQILSGEVVLAEDRFSNAGVFSEIRDIALLHLPEKDNAVLFSDFVAAVSAKLELKSKYVYNYTYSSLKKDKRFRFVKHNGRSYLVRS